MVVGILIVFRLQRKQKGLTAASVTKFYRKLYGYENSSCYGRYHTYVKGLLDNIKSVKYFNSIIIVRKSDSRKIISFLREYGADILTWEVTLKVKEARTLGLK